MRILTIIGIVLLVLAAVLAFTQTLVGTNLIILVVVGILLLVGGFYNGRGSV